MKRLLYLLQTEEPTEEEKSVFLLLNWAYLKDQPIGSVELSDCFKAGHSGIFQGLGELIQVVLGLDMDRDYK